jgi:hypothetical protein
MTGSADASLGQSGAPRRDDVQAMLRVCGALRDHVKALLAANEKSWNQGHGATDR